MSTEVGQALVFLVGIAGGVVSVGGAFAVFGRFALRMLQPEIQRDILKVSDERYMRRDQVGEVAEHKARNELSRWWSECQQTRIAPIEGRLASTEAAAQNLEHAVARVEQKVEAQDGKITTVAEGVARILGILEGRK